MAFPEHLQNLRRDRGWSQEALAEQLGVSRQAVSQWEAAQVQPEVDNLIRLADLFLVTLDDLVRDKRPGDCGFPRPIEPSGTDSAVIAFLLRAKRATYAGKGAEVAPSRPLSHDLRYEEGTFFYYDTFLGGAAFSGEEALWDDGNPFWSMNYVGRVVGEGFAGDFLKECLLLVPADRPFRGPRVHQNGDLIYHCGVEGGFEWFEGREEIYNRGQLVYECRFHGGMVRG